MGFEDDAPWLDGIVGDALPRLISGEKLIIRVVAGPGSGKTTGLKRRVQRLVQGEGVLPRKIFVGTFTRAIARELAEALGVAVVSDELGEEEQTSVAVSTLHSHALRLLRANPAACAGRQLRFLLGYERDTMLYDLGESLAGFPTQPARRRELNRVCAAWAEGADLGLAGFVGEMDRWLRRHRGMLIEEVVNIARVGLEAGDISPGEFDHVVIDEYQDLTAAEQQLVEKIWSGAGSLVVLGDDDQSIYSFRYNHPGGITDFAGRWPGEELDDLTIPENRRCGRVIVEVANAMMAQAGSRKPPMVSMRGEEGDLSVVYWPSLGDEIGGLARYMRERADTNFLVLVPRRFIGYRLKAALGDEAMTSFHEESLEVAVAQERFALASLVSDPRDRIAMRTVLGFDSVGADYGPKRNAVAYRGVIGSPLEGAELLEAIASGALPVSGAGSRHLRERARRVRDFMANLPEGLEAVIDALFNPDTAGVVEDPDKREKARVDLRHIRDAAHAIRRRTAEPSLAKVLDRLRYRIAMRLPLTDVVDARVRIMTLHGAKGLEADVVIVAGVADQIIPGHTPEDAMEAERQREEQRRLLYVSVTRAKRELVVSWPHSMDYKDATKNQVRVDSVFRSGDRKLVRLARSSLLPDIAQEPKTGARWLRERAPGGAD